MADNNGSGMKVVIAAIIISIVLFIMGLVYVYYRDEITKPAGDESSVPAPKTY